jgi:hypothetical protein
LIRSIGSVRFARAVLSVSAALVFSLPSLPSLGAYQVTWNPDGSPVVTEVDVPVQGAPIPEGTEPERELRPSLPPKVVGISLDEIVNAPADRSTTVILQMKYQYPIEQYRVNPAGEATADDERIVEVARTAHRRSQERLREALTAVGGEVLRDYDLLNMLHLRLPTRAIAVLMNMDEVLSIEAGLEKMEGGSPWAWGDGSGNVGYLARIRNHDEAAATIHFNELTFGNNPSILGHYPEPNLPSWRLYPKDVEKGLNQVVALIDNGIDTAHPDLAGKVLRERNFGNEFAPFTAYPKLSHGTQSAGVIAGSMSSSLSPSNEFRGFAPAAKLFDYNVGTQPAQNAGSVIYPNAIDAVNDVLSSRVINGSTYKASVVLPELQFAVSSISIGTPSNQNCTDLSTGCAMSPDGNSALSRALDRAFERNVVPIIPAGNLYETANVYTLSIPGDARKAVTVGASQFVGDPNTNDEQTISYNNPPWQVEFLDPQKQVKASYSGQGPTMDAKDSSGFWVAKREKPEVVAPTNLIAPLMTNGQADYNGIKRRDINPQPLYPQFEPDVVEDGYNGTSAATPVIAAVAAVERQWNTLGLGSGFTVGYLIHEGKRDECFLNPNNNQCSLDANNQVIPQKEVRGWFDGDFIFQSDFGSGSIKAAWEDTIKGGIIPGSTPAKYYSKDYCLGQLVNGQCTNGALPTHTALQNGGKLVVTLWWPERRDHTGAYWASQLALQVIDPNGNLIKQDTGLNSVGNGLGVFRHIVIQNPQAINYTIRVVGQKVEPIDLDTRSDPNAPGWDWRDPNLKVKDDEQVFYLFVTPVKKHG